MHESYTLQDFQCLFYIFGTKIKVYILIPMVVIALLFIIPLFVQVNTCHEWLRKFDEIKIIILENFVEISFN